jgi:tRNA dimethylallyltransferase
MRPRVIFLAGPTATGKTELAAHIAARFPCGIISVDSAMVYRGMDIGTAKPGPDILRDAPHRLIDVCDPSESYSAARFRADALREIAAVQSEGRIPLLVGGTMLYFRALERGLSALPPADPQTRERIEREAAAVGWPAMHARLEAVDAASARRIHHNDPQRIQRALEVHALSGRPMSRLLAERAGEPLPFDTVKLHVLPQEREELHGRIADRFRHMLSQGLLGEVEALYGRGDMHPGLPAIRAVGYRQLWRYLDGRTDLAGAIQAAVVATRQLAKRQLTWMRADGAARRFVAGAPGFRAEILKYIEASATY